MADNPSELEALRTQIDHLEQNFRAELQALREKIQRLEAAALGTPIGPAHIPTNPAPPAAAPATQPLSADIPVDELTIVFEENPPHGTHASSAGPRARFASVSKWGVSKWGASKWGSQVLQLFGPLGSILAQAGAAYRHYRDQGKAPAFLMTVAGIVAITAGVGYLLQYSFDNFLGPGAKLVIGAVIGVGVIAAAAQLHRTHQHLRDYASSLIGLGVIVVYLCGYFAGPYYGFFPTLGTLGAFAATVALAYWLALRFQTRVVAVVTLGGGIIAPWLVSDPSAIEEVYAGFLVLLTGASLHLARRLSWQPLTHLTFASTVAVIELLALQHGTEGWPLRAAASAHFYLFFYFLLFDGLELKRQPARTSLVMLTSLVAFFVLVSVQTTADPQLLAGLLILNAAVVGVPFFLGFTVGSAARPVFILAAGILLGYGLLSLARFDYLGLLWGIEAVGLIAVGLRYRSAAVYYEGLAILALSSASTLWSGLQWLLDGDVLSALAGNDSGIGSGIGSGSWPFPPAWLAMLGLVAYIEIAGRLLRSVDCEMRLTRSLVPWLYELQGVAGALVWLGLVCMVAPEWIAPLATVPLFSLLYLASTRRLTLVQIVGLLHICFLAAAVTLAGLEVGNFHFSEQPALAKLTRIELFAVFWLLQAFYERFYPQSAFARWARPLRQLFYLLVPMFFLPKLIREAPAYLPLALWGSASIAWVLYRFVRSQPLRVETLLLILVASGFTFVACAASYFDLATSHSYWALGTGLVFFALLTVCEGAFVRVQGHPLRMGLIATSFYFGGSIFAVVFAGFESPTLASAVTAGYFAVLAAGHLRMPFVRPVIKASYTLSTTLVALAIIVSVDTALPNWALLLCYVLALASWGYLLHARRPALRLGHRTSGGPIVQQWLWHTLIGLAYASANAAVFHDALGPATSVCLVVHASTIVFLTLRPRWQRLTWLALTLFVSAGCKVVFYDMEDFSIVEKIIALMAMGTVLLGTAYWFQQMRSRTAAATPA